MSNIKHLMIDIEAAGKSTSAALASIGAVFFEPATGELGEKFYQPVKLSSAQYFGGQIDASTVEWWMKQSEEARAVFNAPDRVGLKDALNHLADFIKNQSGESAVHVWGNGPAYDNAILANAFNATWIKQPWSFSKDTCVRTLVMLGRELGIDPKYDMPREGEHHNALDDAIHQARYVSVIWQALMKPHQQEQQTGWISVEDQLPEEGEEVLVSSGLTKEFASFEYDDNDEQKPMWFCRDSFGHQWKEGPRFWMTIPEEQ